MANPITDNIAVWTAAQTPKGSGGRGNGNGSANRNAYGIKKLRELILELAVRGKLVPQDPNDEPASVLLRKIAKEKARLVKEGKIRKQDKLPDVGEDERPFELPDGWEWTRLPTICIYKPGKTPSTKNPIFWSDNNVDGIPWVTISDMEHFGLITDTKKRITQEAVNKVFQDDTIPSGSLLMSFKLTVGKISILGIDAYHNEAIISILPLNGISRDYLFKFLPKRALSGNTKSAIMGNTLNSDSLALLLIPVPPMGEQHRIVAKVNELMVLCDRLEEWQNENGAAHQALVETLLAALTAAANQGEFADAWQRIADYFDTLFTTDHSIDQLKQTILQLAVMGKLVPQDPNDEPASVLLAKIAAEKERLGKEGKIKKQAKLPDVNKAEQPYELPQGWEWCRIGNASLFTEYGMSERTFEGIEGIPVLTMGDIQSGKILLGRQKKVLSSSAGLPALYLNNGDLLYNRTNSAELVGKTGIFIGPDNSYTFASYLIRIRCLSEYISPFFLNIAMNVPLFRVTQIEPHLKQQCGQANVNASIMKNMNVPIPPTAEQLRIVAKVDELMALCDRLKARLKEAQVTQVQLADAVVEQAVA